MLKVLDRAEIPGRDRLVDRLLRGADPFDWTLSSGVRLRIDPSDRINRRFAIRSYERPLLRYLRRALRSGDAVIDGGAHHGYVALHAAVEVAPAGLVLAIEPDPHNVRALRTNVSLNQLPVEVVPAAVGATQGTASFTRNLTQGETGWGSMLADPDDRSESIQVPTVTIDRLRERLAGRRVSLIKLDVQGTEYEALEGARSTLQEDRPIVVVETVDVWWGSRQTRTVADVREFLLAAGYHERSLARNGDLVDPSPDAATGVFVPIS